MDKSLLCAESLYAEEKFAGKDKVILDDERVLEHLLQTEAAYMPRNGQQCFKKCDLDPATRKIVVKWMLEVCEQESCLGPVLPLAVNLLDRFLSKCDVPKKFLQLIAADCLLIASKIRQSLPISISALCYYTDHSVTPCQLRNFETLIATKLKWDLSAVTSFDFIDQILQRVSWCNSRQEKIVRIHAITLLHLCCTDAQFIECKGSTIAAAAIICAMKGIQIRMDVERVSRVCHAVNADIARVEAIAVKIEDIVSDEISRLNAQSSRSATSAAAATGKSDLEGTAENGAEDESYETIAKYDHVDSSKSKKPETPVDVQNVKF